MKTTPPLFQIEFSSRRFEALFVDRDCYLIESRKIFDQIFPGQMRPAEVAGNSLQIEKAIQLRSDFAMNPHSVHILVREIESGAIVGWLTGEQHDWETFYLRNSGFVPLVRLLGIYSSIHSALMNYLHSKGFERVVSDHAPNNKPILMQKIGFGYSINSMTFDDRFGPLVRLIYFFNQDRQREFEARFNNRANG